MSVYGSYNRRRDLGDGGVKTLFQDLDNTPSDLINGAGMFVMIDSSGENIEFKPLIDPSDASIVSKNTFSIGPQGYASGQGGINYDRLTGQFNYYPPLYQGAISDILDDNLSSSNLSSINYHLKFII